jgi:hypothetical protein
MVLNIVAASIVNIIRSLQLGKKVVLVDIYSH